MRGPFRLIAKIMKMLTFPELRQTYNYDCGAKATQAVLAYYGLDVRESVIMKEAGTTRAGTPIAGIVKVLRRHGLRCRVGSMTAAAVKEEIDRGRPVILCLQAWADKPPADWRKDWRDGHFVVAIGYDRSRMYFEDPSSVLRTYLTLRELESRWHDVDTNGRRYFNYGIVAYGRRPTYSLAKKVHMG